MASLGMGVNIGKYYENDPELGDFVTLRVSISANTRKGIYYDSTQWGYSWYNVSNPTNITGYNTGNWLTIPWELGGPFLFYGVEYTSIWVCSNGFVCLNSNYTNATPSSIPSANKPDTIIAPFWRDLDPSAGGNITYGLIYGTPNLFVISWNNVPNKADTVPQTFQLVIRGRVGGSNEFQNALLFQYKSITKDPDLLTTVGIEDQTGSKGTSVDPNSLGNNNYCLLFQYSIMGCRLVSLKIKLTKVDTYAVIEPMRTDEYLGGYNVILNNSANPCGEVFGAAIGFAADLLITNYEAGIIFDTLLITTQALSNYFSGQLSRPIFDSGAAGHNETEAFVSATCADEDSLVMPFDATLADVIIWGLTDNNNRNHLLTVTAESTYKSIDDLSTHTISTSVTLYMYAVTPSTPEGPTHVFTDYAYNYSTSYTDQEGFPVRYEFNWSDGTEDTITGWKASGVTVTAQHSWASPRTYQVRARTQNIYDEYWSGVWTGWSPPLNVTVGNRYLTINTRIYSTGARLYNVKVWINSVLYYSPVTIIAAAGTTYNIQVESTVTRSSATYVFYRWNDGSTANPRTISFPSTGNVTLTAYYLIVCPSLFVWNGSQYVYETVLDIHAESDITVQHEIEQQLALDGTLYKLELRELDNFTSHIDQVKLYAVDSTGEWYLCPLKSANYNGIVVTKTLQQDDDKRINLAPTETVSLKFQRSIPYSETAYFIFEINGYNKKVP